ncbi:hypothetical protein TKK_0007543 [Trichogramma kaykai]|uniref:Methyltransferase type 11 domain-containing protein n=1 Tax=Trichogramma kaykai TaxID=54128 RepID=A0ABD2WHB9_9HYME
MANLSFSQAKSKFELLLQSVKNEDKDEFLSFAFEALAQAGIYSLYNQGKNPKVKGDEDFDDDILNDPIVKLNTIAEHVKKILPLEAILPSEKFVVPQDSSKNSDCKPDITISVDEFLYDDEDIDDLVDQGKMSRFYCTKCKSKNIKPLIFISHSMSKDALYYIFNDRLPTIENKTVLDIGSRFGAVLYGAHVFTDAKSIIGVEMNEELCTLQNEVIQKYNMDDRIKVVHDKIQNVPDIVASADVVVINNSFEFYLTIEEQTQIWKYLNQHIKKGAFLVTNPPLNQTLEQVPTDIELQKWVKKFNLDDKPSDNDKDSDNWSDNDKFSDYEVYQVL